MFAVLVQERDPLSLDRFWPGLEYWVQVVGGFAAFGLLVWIIYRTTLSLGSKIPMAPSVSDSRIVVCDRRQVSQLQVCAWIGLIEAASQ